ncbi:MAG TPA: SCO family protein [bacterium]|nr:SCO family protein [bacterium]
MRNNAFLHGAQATRTPRTLAGAAASRMALALGCLVSMLWLASPVLAHSTGTKAPPPAYTPAHESLAGFGVGNYALGGEFTLTGPGGKPVSLHQFTGRVVILFFGYTHCDDECPTTVSQIAQVQKRLGAQAGRVQPLFITIDPARDTPARLQQWLGKFGGHMLGLTGSEADIQRVAEAYQTRFQKGQPVKGGYDIDHTLFVYLLDGHGKVRYLFPYDVQPALLLQGAMALLHG